jgi:hypothetical protein
MIARLKNRFGLVLLLVILGGPGLLAASIFDSLILALLGPVVMAAALFVVAALPIRRKVTPEEFANELQHHLDGTDKDGDWDRTTSVKISDPLLDGVRQSVIGRFDSLANLEDREELRQVIEGLRRGGSDYGRVPMRLQNGK